jgi:hypothetical protein
VWVTGIVEDATTGAPLAGVNVTGVVSVLTNETGIYALYAPVVGDRVVVYAAALANYSSQIGTAVFHADVLAYSIPLLLNPLTVHETFVPAAGLPKVTIADVFGRSVHVTAPPVSNDTAAQLPSDLTVSIAVIPPGSSPGLMESVDPGDLSNSTTLQVRAL